MAVIAIAKLEVFDCAEDGPLFPAVMSKLTLPTAVWLPAPLLIAAIVRVRSPASICVPVELFTAAVCKAILPAFVSPTTSLLVAAACNVIFAALFPASIIVVVTKHSTSKSRANTSVSPPDSSKIFPAAIALIFVPADNEIPPNAAVSVIFCCAVRIMSLWAVSLTFPMELI